MLIPTAYFYIRKILPPLGLLTLLMACGSEPYPSPPPSTLVLEELDTSEPLDPNTGQPESYPKDENE